MQSGRFNVLFLLFGNTAVPALSIDPCPYLSGNMIVEQDNDLQFKQHLFPSSAWSKVVFALLRHGRSVPWKLLLLYSMALVIIRWIVSLIMQRHYYAAGASQATGMQSCEEEV